MTETHSELLFTNPLLCEGNLICNVRSILALLLAIDISHSKPSGEANSGLQIIHDWLRRSLAYSAPEDETQLRYTNPLINDDMVIDNIRAVLALLGTLDVSDCALGEEGNSGLYIANEWMRRSLLFSGRECGLAIPLRKMN